MDFGLQHIGWDNLFRYGFNAIEFSIIGMLIVYAGLSFITVYIVLLPKMLNWVDKRKKKMSRGEDDAAIAETELLLAIAVALHLDQTRNGGKQRITWARHEETQTPWQAAGRIRGLSVRSHLPRRRPGE